MALLVDDSDVEKNFVNILMQGVNPDPVPFSVPPTWMEYRQLPKQIPELRHLAKGPDRDPTKGWAGSLAAADRL